MTYLFGGDQPVTTTKPLDFGITEVLAYRCTGCAICVQSCPNDVIRMKGGKASIRYPEDCAACFLCVEDCPREAISIGLRPV
ncbi:MAG: 4Fe-4S binding protein [Chloroflexi bacterium]|nr:4Fe-4S binding protein [Chloroflexota bacterium]